MKNKKTGLGIRKCHDCGAKTTNYRCPKCLKEWKKKHHVSDKDE